MTLLVIPPLQIHKHPSGKPVLTKKFLDGMAEYCRHWPGNVIVLAEPSETADNNLDHVTVDAEELPFRLQIHSFSDHRSLHKCFSQSRVVLATLDYRQTDFWRIGRLSGIPVAYVAEQSLRTRRQIIRAEVKNPLRRLRRLLREPATERHFCEAIRNSAGIQCNGTPTFEAYESISPRPLLFFDTRVGQEMIASDHDLNQRTDKLRNVGPLRLAFSGRLIAIKGVCHLPRVANELRKLGVKFTLDIFGGGDQEEWIRREIVRLNLTDIVRLRGVADFSSELVPEITKHVDLFICCHLQGDPSCTYLETMSCGVPIVGYDNEAFVGLVRHCQIGWTVAMNDAEALASRIAELDRNREMLAEAAYQAREFAKKHFFQETMRRRIEHIMSCVEIAKQARLRVGDGNSL